MADEKKQIKKEEGGPAPWKPVNIEKFNKNTKEVSKFFKSDPERVNEVQNGEDAYEENTRKK